MIAILQAPVSPIQGDTWHLVSLLEVADSETIASPAFEEEIDELVEAIKSDTRSDLLQIWNTLLGAAGAESALCPGRRASVLPDSYPEIELAEIALSNRDGRRSATRKEYGSFHSMT